MRLFKIVSDGINHRVLDADGNIVEGVTRVDIYPLLPDEICTAEVHMHVALEVVAEVDDGE